MAETTEEINRIINEELTHYRAYVLGRLSDSLRAARLELTGDTLKSLRAELLAASASGVAALLLHFADSGRIREMKGLTWRKLPPQAEIEAYVRKVGVGKFKYVPGYAPGRIPTEDIAVRRIAWGIRTAKRRENTTKPKKWYAKTFYGTLDVLVDGLVTRVGTAAGRTVGGSISDGLPK